ncbi:MAG: hypothetical protein ABUS54_14915 [Actinomycetota bacterium]
MATCRVCGATCEPEALRAVHEGGGCRRCNGSPACARCGHPRRHHRGTFGGGDDLGCRARVTGEDLVVGRCGCPGYTTDRAAYGEAVDIVEAAPLRLRLPGEPAEKLAPLAPVRDLFDEGRRLRGPDEPLPWRPPR